MTTTTHLDTDSKSVDPRLLSESEAIKYTANMPGGALDGVAATSAFARDKARLVLEQDIDRAEQGADGLGKDVLSANDVARAYVKEYPVRSLLMAAAAGVVVAAALRLLGPRGAPEA